MAVVSVFIGNVARGDLLALAVTGPHSGSGFSNIGAVSTEAVVTTLTNADVLIELQKREGDVLTATCTAVFDLDTDPSTPKEGQRLLVAFPVTGIDGEAVKITQFEVVIDGVRKPDLEVRTFQLYSEPNVPIYLVGDSFMKANPDTLELLGPKVHEGTGATDRLLMCHAWKQNFLPGKHCRVQIKYLMTLHAQSLAYTKKVQHGQSLNIVPFDAMWAGASDERAFFLDYILRSGATWKGPIGHETVILRAAKNSGITFDTDRVITFGRQRFAGLEEDLRESMMRVRAGVDAPGVKQGADSIVWEIDHEKPTQDILVQIPATAVQIGVKR